MRSKEELAEEVAEIEAISRSLDTHIARARRWRPWRRLGFVLIAIGLLLQIISLALA